MAPRAAIVGTHATTALADGVEATVEAWLSGRTALVPLAGEVETFGHAEAARLGLPPAGFVESPAASHVPEAHARVLRRCVRAAHEAARAEALPRDRVGFHVALGVSDADPTLLAEAVVASRGADGGFDLGKFFSDGYRRVHPLFPLSLLNNVAAGESSMEMDIRGDNTVLAGDADAGALAFVEALSAIEEDAVSAAVVAGVADPVCPASLLRSATGHGPLAPLGEGGAALVLESEASALARGAKPAAFVTGAAAGFGAFAGGDGPAADAIVRVAREALAAAGRTPEDVGLLLADGGFVGEAGARRTLFGRAAAPAVAVPTLALGRLGAGTAAVHVALACALLARGIAPSPSGGRPRDLSGARMALVLASGRSGGAAALVVEAAA